MSLIHLAFLISVGVALVRRAVRGVSLILKTGLTLGLSLEGSLDRVVILVVGVLAARVFPGLRASWHCLFDSAGDRSARQLGTWVDVLVERVLLIFESRLEGFAIIIIARGCHVVLACFVSEGRIRLEVRVERVRGLAGAHLRLKQPQTLPRCSYLIIHIVLVRVLLMTVGGGAV